MALQHCAGAHNVIINVKLGESPFCCQACQDNPHDEDACNCGISPPTADNAPKGKSGGRK